VKQAAVIAKQSDVDNMDNEVGEKKHEIRENASDESHELHTSPHASRRDVWQFLASGDLLVKFW
jgi:hypothetical protein